MPHFGVDPETTKPSKPVPAGWYYLKVKELKCKKSPKGYNYVAYCNVVNAKDLAHNDSFVQFMMNNGFKQGFMVFDFCHGLGFPMEKDGSFTGGNAAWVLDPIDPENVEKAKYKGPLLGKVFEAELVIDSWEGNERNKVRQIRCAIKDCASKYPDNRHQTDLIGKK